MNAIQPKYLIHICIVLTIVLSVSAGFNFVHAKSAGHVDGTSVRFISEYKRRDVRVTSVCAEGYVVLVAHSDVGQGGGLQMLQVQNDVGDKIVPMVCDLNDFSPSTE